MPPRCSVCSHPSLREIDRGLLAGTPYLSLPAQYGLSPSAICRHTKHLAHQLDLRRDEQERSHQAALLERLDLLNVRLDRLSTPLRISAPSTSPSVVSGNRSASSPSWSACARASEAAPDDPVTMLPWNVKAQRLPPSEPFRNHRGPITKNAAYKAGCLLSGPGPPRHSGGTICGPHLLDGTDHVQRLGQKTHLRYFFTARLPRTPIKSRSHP